MMGIEYVNVWYGAGGDEIFFRSNQAGLINVQGYEGMIQGQYFDIDGGNKVFSDPEFRYRVNSKLDTIAFIGTVPDSLHIDLKPLYNQLLTEYGNVNVRNIPPEKMMVQAENQYLRVKIYFRLINLHSEENQIKPMRFGADILIGLKDKSNLQIP